MILVLQGLPGDPGENGPVGPQVTLASNSGDDDLAVYK